MEMAYERLSCPSRVRLGLHRRLIHHRRFRRSEACSVVPVNPGAAPVKRECLLASRTRAGRAASRVDRRARGRRSSGGPADGSGPRPARPVRRRGAPDSRLRASPMRMHASRRGPPILKVTNLLLSVIDQAVHRLSSSSVTPDGLCFGKPPGFISLCRSLSAPGLRSRRHGPWPTVRAGHMR